MFCCKITRIHVWGGLGSQFFALMYLLRLKSFYPKRNFHILLHEDKYFPFKFHRSGDTDLDDLNLPLVTESILDFYSQYSLINKRHHSVKRIWHKLVKFPSNTIRRLFSFYPDFSDHPFLPGVRIRSITGHYTNLKYNLEDFSHLRRLVGIDDIKTSKDLVIHFRQGDLKLVGKLSINQSILLDRVREELLSGFSFENIAVISESTAQDFLSCLRTFQIDTKFLSIESSAIQVIKYGVASRTFIGGESKLSFWIALFRCMSDSEGKTYLPKSLERLFNDCAPQNLVTEPCYY